MATVKKSKAARFYYDLGIDYVFPEKPKTDTLSDDEWITERCWLLGDEIQEKLSSGFDEIQFSSFKRIAPNANVFTIHFFISKCHNFSSNEIWSPKKEYSGFKIKKQPLLIAKKSIESEIRRFLYDDYYIETLSLQYIASRDFVFEIYFGGFLTVEKIFSPEEIGGAGGVSYALKDFFEEMSSALQKCGLEGYISQTNARRNRSNKYVFEVSATCHSIFSEMEVAGEIALLERDMSIDKVRMIGIENIDDALGATIADTKSAYKCELEQYRHLI